MCAGGGPFQNYIPGGSEYRSDSLTADDDSGVVDSTPKKLPTSPVVVPRDKR